MVHVWKANSTMRISGSVAAIWKTLKIFFQPERRFFACALTKCAIQRTTISRIVADLYWKERQSIGWIIKGDSYPFFFIITSKGLRNSFWKRKLGNSPFSKNFIDNCRRESTAKNDTSCNGWHAAYHVEIKAQHLHRSQETSTNLIEMFSDDFPDSRPLKSNTSHVIIGDFDDFQ